MTDQPRDSRANDVTNQVAGLPEEVTRITTGYQRKMSACLHDIAQLDGLQELSSRRVVSPELLRLFGKVLALFDESTQFVLGHLRRRGFRVSCRPGCPHCCFQMPAGLSTIELIYLYYGMHRSGIGWRFFRRCLEAEEEWAEIVRQSTIGTAPGTEATARPMEALLTSYQHVERSCPFLLKNLCQVYPYRPFACRMHFSLSPPHWCRTSHFDNPYIVAFNLEAGEGVYQALEELDNRFQLNLSHIMVCGLLQLTVNVMHFE